MTPIESTRLQARDAVANLVQELGLIIHHLNEAVEIEALSHNPIENFPLLREQLTSAAESAITTEALARDLAQKITALVPATSPAATATPTASEIQPL